MAASRVYLALYKPNGQADLAFSSHNRDYLACNPRGWAKCFRGTEQSVKYQAG